MFRIIRMIIGWSIILLGYFAVYTAIAVAVGWEYDFGISVVAYYLLGDLFLVVGTWVAGGKPFRGKPSFTSPVMAIVVWVVMLALYPVIHLLVQVKELLKALFKKLFSKPGNKPQSFSAKNANYIPPEGEADTRTPASNSVLQGEVGSLCRDFSGRDQLGDAIEIEYGVSPRYFSHEITLEAKQRVTIDASRFGSEYDVEIAKSDIRAYQNGFSNRMKSLQNEVIDAIENLQRKHNSFDGEWAVRVEIKTDTREV